MDEVKIRIEYIDHYKVVLHSEKGHTFTFNPQTKNGEELLDFLNA